MLLPGCKYKLVFAALLLLLFSGTDLLADWTWKFPFYSDPPPVSLPAKDSVSAPLVRKSSPALLKNHDPSGKSPDGNTLLTPLPAQLPVLKSVDLKATAASDSDKSTPAKLLPTLALQPRQSAQFKPDFTYQTYLVNEDSHWKGQVLLDGWVTVAPHATLFIHPGTLIRAADGSGLLVQGRLVMKGEADRQIVISSLFSESRSSDWRGIFFIGTDKNNIFEHVRLEGAETAINARFSSFSARQVAISNSLIGVHLQGGTGFLSAASFTSTETGIVVTNSELTLDKVSFERSGRGIVASSSELLAADLLIARSSFTGLSAEQTQLKIERLSAVGNETGARLEKCEGSIIDSTFRDNRESGAVLIASGIKMTGNLFTGNKTGLQLDDNLPAVWGSAFYSNRSYNFLYLGEEKLYFGGNWFGGAEKGELERTFFSKRPGAVRLDPVLAANPLLVR